MKKIIFTLFTLLLLGSLQGQTIDNYITFALQRNYVSNKDDVMSPLLYRGHHGALRAGYKRINAEGAVNEVYGTISLGYIQPDAYPEFNSGSISSMGALTYRHFKKISDTIFGYPFTFK